MAYLTMNGLGAISSGARSTAVRLTPKAPAPTPTGVKSYDPYGTTPYVSTTSTPKAPSGGPSGPSTGPTTSSVSSSGGFSDALKDTLAALVGAAGTVAPVVMQAIEAKREQTQARRDARNTPPPEQQAGPGTSMIPYALGALGLVIVGAWLFSGKSKPQVLEPRLALPYRRPAPRRSPARRPTKPKKVARNPECTGCKRLAKYKRLCKKHAGSDFVPGVVKDITGRDIDNIGHLWRMKEGTGWKAEGRGGRKTRNPECAGCKRLAKYKLLCKKHAGSDFVPGVPGYKHTQMYLGNEDLAPGSLGSYGKSGGRRRGSPRTENPLKQKRRYKKQAGLGVAPGASILDSLAVNLAQALAFVF